MGLLVFLARSLFGAEESALAYSEVSQLLDNLGREGERIE